MRTYKRKNVPKATPEPIEGVLGLCRLCLEEATDSIPIFVNKFDICTSLATRIMMCVGYEITREECLPNTICMECFNKLNKYYEFRKKCDSTYYKLKNHLLAVQARTAKQKIAEQAELKEHLENNALVCPNSQPSNQSVDVTNQSILPTSRIVCPTDQSVCVTNQSVLPNDITVSQTNQTVDVTSQSFQPINMTVYSTNHPVDVTSQSVLPTNMSVYPINDSICVSSQSVLSNNKPVCPNTHTVYSNSLSHSSISDSVYICQSQSETAQSHPACTVSQSICANGQPLCAASQSNNIVGDSNNTVCKLENTEVHTDYTANQAFHPIGQSSLISHLVTLSRDHLVLAFEKPLEIVQNELLQNGVHNEVNKETNAVVIDKSIEDVIQEPYQNEPLEVCPDITEFLSSILIEMGILKGKQNELQLIQECGTIQVETDDCKQLTFELVQIEEEQSQTLANKRTKGKGKSINETTKKQKDVRPRCERCGREFASRAVLARHARTHTGERPFRCDTCGQCFAQKEVLTRHVLVHQEVRPFACPRCPKSFTQRGALAAHARRHAAAPPDRLFLCTLCPKKFLHASGLSRHARAHAGHVWACSACGRAFSDDSALRRHARRQHAEGRASRRTHAPARATLT